MPYLAVELDAVNLAPLVGRGAGIDEDAALAGLVRLWALCFRTKQDHVTAARLVALFGGEPACVAAALVEFGFLEPQGDGWRVRGAQRYLRLQEAWSKGGHAAKSNLIPGAAHRQKPSAPADEQPMSSPTPPIGCPSALTPSTEHQTPNTKEETNRSAGEAPASGGEEPVSDSRSAQAQRVFEHWRTVMAKDGKTKFDGKRKSNVLARLKAGYSAEDLMLAVDGCHRTPFNMGRNDSNKPFNDLELICRDSKHVDEFRGTAVAPAHAATGPPPDVRKGHVRAETQDHTDKGFGF